MLSMEIVDVLVSFFSALLGGIASLWVAKKVMFSRQNIMESVDSVLEYALNTIEGQMKVKAVMEKISEGLIKGSGLGGRGSKPKLQDVLIQLGLNYAQSKGWLGGGSEGPQNQQNQSKKPWEA
jgi:hypothetical protein